MSARNGDKAHHSINRKRAIQRRVKSRELLKALKERAGAGTAKAGNAPDPGKS